LSRVEQCLAGQLQGPEFGMDEVLHLAGMNADLVLAPHVPELFALGEKQLGKVSRPGRCTSQSGHPAQARDEHAGQEWMVVGGVEQPDRGVGEPAVADAAGRAAIGGQVTGKRDVECGLPQGLGSLGEALREEGKPIHILINNAGVMTPPDRQITADGFELQFGSNYLGHFALVAHLLPVLRDGRARVTWQISVAANSGVINRDDLNWERSYHGMNAYRQSKIAFGLFGLELDRRSQAGDWGISSNLSHPGVAPTNLLAARPELGRSEETSGRKFIRTLSERGILLGTVETAKLPALMAATVPEAKSGALYGPRGPGHLAGPPAEQRTYSRLHSADDAQRMWHVSQKLTKVSFTTS
jgi:NAD(P)-dependent dehydrogenase (short-subunit alcohol dehydrogenase family)